MRLAIVDPQDNVLISWPSPAQAHEDIAEEFAVKCTPRRWQRRKRKRLARQLVQHLLELQDETRRL